MALGSDKLSTADSNRNESITASNQSNPPSSSSGAPSNQRKMVNYSGISSTRIRKSQYSYSSCKQRQLMNFLADRYWMPYSNRSTIANIAKDHAPFMKQMNLMKKLPIHDGCVNTICWNKTGEYILSGSDDGNLCITKPLYLFDDSKDYTVLHKIPRCHMGNIFGAQFMPNTGDSILVSCSSEGPVIVHDLNSVDTPAGIISYNCHSSTIYDVMPIHDCDNVFLSCSEDRTIRLFDLRVHRSCSRASTCPHPALIRNSSAMTTISVHPLNSNLVLVGRADGVGLVYDRRKLPDPAKFSREKAHAERLTRIKSGQVPSSGYRYMHPLEGVVGQFALNESDEKYRFTSLCYNATGNQVLASYSTDYVYLFDHDRSSNMELIQTLPKKADDSSGNGNSRNQNRNIPGDQRNGSNSNSNDSNTSRATLVSRIRLRGDWSDTGVNSVPLSSRSANSPRGVYATLQQAAEVALRTRITGIRPIIRPYNNINNIRSDEEGDDDDDRDIRRRNSDSRGGRQQRAQSQDQEQQHQRTIEEENEEDFDCDTSVDDENGDHESNSDFDPDFEITFQPLPQDESTNITSAWSGRDDEDDANEEGDPRSRSRSRSNRGNNSNDDDDDNSSENDQRSSSSKKSRSSRVSDQTKLKFRRAFDGLKNRLNKIPTYHPQIKYQGHRNSKTFIKEAVFWGNDYIMSGSDCGRVFVWEKNTAKIVTAFPADERVVNCLAPNPHFYALATSGIDYDIKLWSTQFIKEAPLLVSKDEMNKIVVNNELMLEESKQTISVPPQLFFNVLASLARNRLSS